MTPMFEYDNKYCSYLGVFDLTNDRDILVDLYFYKKGKEISFISVRGPNDPLANGCESVSHSVSLTEAVRRSAKEGYISKALADCLIKGVKV